MNYILFDGPFRDNLLPLTFTRPVAEIRLGITTIKEKWELLLKTPTSVLTQDYLTEKYPSMVAEDNVFVNASVLPTDAVVEEINSLSDGEMLKKDEISIAFRISASGLKNANYADTLKDRQLVAGIDLVENSWDIFAKNEKYIKSDFELLTSGRKSKPLSNTNFIKGDKDLIFLEEGAKVDFAYLNTEDGPIYLAKDAQIWEGSKIRGPFAMGEKAIVKMAAKIYKGTTVGPQCKVGGEVNNVVFFGYSNKAHDGFLGNAVVGEWCNLGADTNNSNLKNTYEEVKLWSYPQKCFVKTGLQFCGTIIGDHSKTGINTMFNTGTVVGVSCNLYGSGFQRNFIPSFSWGSPLGMKTFNLKKAFQVAAAVYKRRGLEFDEVEQKILTHIHEMEQGEA